jgi:hypothetical protein
VRKARQSGRFEFLTLRRATIASARRLASGILDVHQKKARAATLAAA